MQFLEYGEREINYLKQKDKRLKEAIERIGIINREYTPDLFVGIINCIVGQQISMKAANTIWNRLVSLCDQITPTAILTLSDKELQRCGITMRKALYIKNIAKQVQDGSFEIDRLYLLSDEEVIERLDSLNGIGRWTAEMLMIFSMGRMNILSWDDLAIRRGIKMLYHHKTLNKDRFMKYKRRYSPYGTIASLYLWEISQGK